jgi:hypothetical protein
LKKRRPNTAVSLDYASSDDISPPHIAHFMVEAMYTLCMERSRLRIDRKKVSVGTHGDWDLGLIEGSLGTQPPLESKATIIEKIGPCTTHQLNQWNLWMLEDLLKGYIQRSRLQLRRRRASYKSLLWLICLIEMSLSIRWFRWSGLPLEDCFEDLNWLKLEWSKVD